MHKTSANEPVILDREETDQSEAGSASYESLTDNRVECSAVLGTRTDFPSTDCEQIVTGTTYEILVKVLRRANP